MLKKLKELRERAKENGEPVLRDKSFALLLETVAKKNPARVLEIGTNVGLSGIAILLACPNARLTGIEIDEEKIAAAKENYKAFGVSDRAKIFSGDASEVIPKLSGKYDFIFLDGPKGHYAEYLPYLTDVLEKNGILFADNVLFRGYVDDSVKTPHRYNTTKNSMRKFLQGVSDSERFATQIINIEDGVSITEKLK